MALHNAPNYFSQMYAPSLNQKDFWKCLMSHWVFPESKIECRRLENVWGESWGFPTMQVQTCITDESSKRLADVFRESYSGLDHQPDTPVMKWTRPWLNIGRTGWATSFHHGKSYREVVCSKEVPMWGMWIGFRSEVSLDKAHAHSYKRNICMSRVFQTIQQKRQAKLPHHS